MTALSRREIRQHLRDVPDRFATGPAAAQAQIDLSRHLSAVLADLLPQELGIYWPFQSEFNAPAACLGDSALASVAISLPYAQRTPAEMHYRHWNRAAPTLVDECGIPSCEGAAVVPDVVLVPCLGFTPLGYRLGYGGGYFDRWLAQHPHVTAVGVAWSVGELSEAEFAARAHDLPLMLVVTEQGVV
ncbi:MAG TPA: 5-formyltetrahydrofolate cyclo-ligase [Albitalea sp.]|nr:5-formyltetrahydrofolate cyclo-ligase [Albitalea sp.]